MRIIRLNRSSLSKEKRRQNTEKRQTRWEFVKSLVLREDSKTVSWRRTSFVFYSGDREPKYEEGKKDERNPLDAETSVWSKHLPSRYGPTRLYQRWWASGEHNRWGWKVQKTVGKRVQNKSKDEDDREDELSSKRLRFTLTQITTSINGSALKIELFNIERKVLRPNGNSCACLREKNWQRGPNSTEKNFWLKIFEAIFALFGGQETGGFCMLPLCFFWCFSFNL